jgi:DNA-binding MarR family transcriptional regulator
MRLPDCIGKPADLNNRLSGLSLRVMILLADAKPDNPIYMRRLIDLTGKQSSELTPVVNRLVALEWVQDKREQADASDLGRHPRRYLYITTTGRIRLNAVPLSAVTEARKKNGTK